MFPTIPTYIHPFKPPSLPVALSAGPCNQKQQLAIRTLERPTSIMCRCKAQEHRSACLGCRMPSTLDVLRDYKYAQEEQGGMITPRPAATISYYNGILFVVVLLNGTKGSLSRPCLMPWSMILDKGTFGRRSVRERKTFDLSPTRKKEIWNMARIRLSSYYLALKEAEESNLCLCPHIGKHPYVKFTYSFHTIKSDLQPQPWPGERRCVPAHSAQRRGYTCPRPDYGIVYSIPGDGAD